MRILKMDNEDIDYVPKSFLEGYENLLEMYNEGIILFDDGKELDESSKKAIADAVLKSAEAENKINKIASNIS